MSLVDIMLRYSSIFTPEMKRIRRVYLEGLSAATLESEAREFCGGAPWAAWQHHLESEAAFQALGKS